MGIYGWAGTEKYLRTPRLVQHDGGRFNMDFILNQEVSHPNAFEI